MKPYDTTGGDSGYEQKGTDLGINENLFSKGIEKLIGIPKKMLFLGTVALIYTSMAFMNPNLGYTKEQQIDCTNGSACCSILNNITFYGKRYEESKDPDMKEMRDYMLEQWKECAKPN